MVLVGEKEFWLFRGDKRQTIQQINFMFEIFIY